MKPILCFLILLVLLPVSCTISVIGLRGDTVTYEASTLSSLARSDGGPDFRIRVEGFLLRLGAPDSVLVGKDYVFPFVDRWTAERAVAEGTFSFSGEETPVVALVRPESLPVEAFMRPPAGKSEPVAIPYALQGTRQVRAVQPSSRIAVVAGLTGTREVVVLDGSSSDISRSEGITFGVLALVFLWLGLRLFRSWRRERRLAREAVARHMRRHESLRQGQPTPPARPAVRVSRGWRIPWGKVAGVLIVLGIAGARLGKNVVPVADNVARGVVKSADSVTSAGKGAGRAAREAAASGGHGLELPSVSELALEGLGQAPNVKTVVQGVHSPAPPQGPSPGTRSATRLDLTIKVLESKETYAPLAVGAEEGAPPGVLVFTLVKMYAENAIEGRITGAARVSETRETRDLPDEQRGEFIRLELRPSGTGARLTHVLAMATEHGYVEIHRATGDMEFAGAGSWDRLVAGEVPVVLLFTDEGAKEYARTFEPIAARSAEESLRDQGLPGMNVTATYIEPPVQDLVFEKGKLTFSLRGVSILEMRARNRRD